MAEAFRVDLGLAHLHKLFQAAPRETRKATAKILNDEAFTFRELAPRVLSERLIVRNKAFMRLAFWVEKAKPAQDPAHQVAEAGSLRMKNFSGWAEMVTGQAPKRDRTIGLNARGGSASSQARQENRLTSGNMIGTRDFSEIPERSRIGAMLRIIASSPHYTGMSAGRFVITGGNWTPGVYRFKAGYQATYKKSKRYGVSIKGPKQGQRKNNQGFYWLSEGIKRVQTLGKAPISKRFNWPNETINRVHTWLDIDARWAEYFGDAIKAYLKH